MHWILFFHLHLIIYIRLVTIWSANQFNALNMLRKHSFKTFCGVALTTLLLGSCASHYQMDGITRSRVLIDKRWDAQPVKEAVSFLAPYKHQVDSIMSPVVGETDHYMAARKPESDLSNLLADILLWSGKAYNQKPDFAVYNMGGIRAAFPKGTITYGDVVDVAPFENKICFLTLSGEATLQLFQEMAKVHGEGVSHGVKLVIGKDGSLKSATLNGKEIDPKASYRVATLDYLSQGNDHLDAFKLKTDVFSPQGEKDNVRQIIVNFFKEDADQGRKTGRTVEGRIVIQ